MISKKLRDEFSNITNNQAYINAFCKRVLKPNTQDIQSDPYLGNTQRRDFIPQLRTLLQALPSEAHVFDVGGGNGEIVELAIHQSAPKSTRVSVEEPNPQMLADYVKRLTTHQLLQGELFPCTVQHLYQRNLAASCDLILSLHMIYHLTNWQQAVNNPQEDLKQFFRFLYRQLKPGGKIFLVYANQELGFVGQAGVRYLQAHNAHAEVEMLQQLYRTRNSLLLEGEVTQDLNKHFPEYRAAISSQSFASRFYGESLDDLTAMALIGELLPSDEQPFALEKLHCAHELITQQGDDFGLYKETDPGPRKGMWGINQPQVAATITKNL